MKLVDVDERKGLAVFEEEGEKACLKVDFDNDGNPVVTDEVATEFHRRMEKERTAERQTKIIPGERPGGIKRAPILDLREEQQDGN